MYIYFCLKSFIIEILRRISPFSPLDFSSTTLNYGNGKKLFIHYCLLQVIRIQNPPFSLSDSATVSVDVQGTNACNELQQWKA